MDDCLHEMTNIRHDLPSLLQLRPRAVKPPPSPSSGSMTPSWNKGKGKQPTQGKGKGKPKGQQGKQRVQWITEIKLPDGTLKQLCMRFPKQEPAHWETAANSTMVAVTRSREWLAVCHTVRRNTRRLLTDSR